MKDKYCTPQIEELRVGLIVEKHLWTDKEPPHKTTWNKTIITEGMMFDFYNDSVMIYSSYEVALAKFRVKYLDRADVESLGFKKWPDQDDNIYDLKDVQLHLDYLMESPKGIGVVIFNEAADQLFLGYIKNLNELKIILKQIGVDYE